MTHRCLIVDDEPLAAEVIESYIARLDGFEVAAKCPDAASALTVLGSERIDLVFLDIEMPQMKGTDLLRSLSDPPAVIFTTAHREFALEGFELDALDYLLKPVSFERFMKAVDRYLSTGRTKAAGQAGDGSGGIGAPGTGGGASGAGATGGFVNVRADRKTVRVPAGDILYIEGMKDYVNIVTRGGSVSTNTTLQGILDRLPAGRFIRIHRSYIVAVDKVTAFDSETVELGKKQLPVGRHYRPSVLEALGDDHS